MGKILIGTPFSHSQKLHYCLIRSVYFHNQTDLVIISGLSLSLLCDLLVSTPQPAACRSEVLVAIVVIFALPSIPVPVVPFCHYPDPLSIPQAGARSSGMYVHVLSGHRLMVNKIDRT